MAQMNEPAKNDWVKTVLNDIEYFDLNLTIKEIEEMPKLAFKKLVKKKEKQKTLEQLTKEKTKHTKVAHIKHSVLEIQEYLKPGELSIQEAKFLFSLRSRMLDIKCNFKGKYSNTLCPLCKKEEDSQKHLLVCDQLNEDGILITSLPIYGDLYGPSLDEQVMVSRIIKKQYTKRKNKIG